MGLSCRCSGDTPYPLPRLRELPLWRPIDLIQKPHSLLRNYPILGHMRNFLEEIGPELREYIVTSNDEELPFSRNQRRWIYSSSKLQNNYYGFGTDNTMEYTHGYPIIKHRTFAGISPTDARASRGFRRARYTQFAISRRPDQSSGTTPGRREHRRNPPGSRAARY